MLSELEKENPSRMFSEDVLAVNVPYKIVYYNKSSELNVFNLSTYENAKTLRYILQISLWLTDNIQIMYFLKAEREYFTASYGSLKTIKCSTRNVCSHDTFPMLVYERCWNWRRLISPKFVRKQKP